MSKPVESELLYAFVQYIRRGNIGVNETAPDGTFKLSADDLEHAENVLSEMRQAAAAILRGEPPDKALNIVRPPGRMRKDHTFDLAVQIHKFKYQQNNTWEGVELLANGWLEKRELPTVSQARLKQVYRANKDSVLRFFQQMQSLNKST